MLMHALLLPLERSMYDRLMRPFWLARPGKGRRPGHLSVLLLPLLVHRAMPISRAGGGAWDDILASRRAPAMVQRQKWGDAAHPPRCYRCRANSRSPNGSLPVPRQTATAPWSSIPPPAVTSPQASNPPGSGPACSMPTLPFHPSRRGRRLRALMPPPTSLSPVEAAAFASRLLTRSPPACWGDADGASV